MSDPFFTKKICDRCGKPLSSGRIMSMFNEDVLCMDCYEAEKKDPDYKKAVEAEMNACRAGDFNFKGIRGK